MLPCLLVLAPPYTTSGIESDQLIEALGRAGLQSRALNGRAIIDKKFRIFWRVLFLFGAEASDAGWRVRVKPESSPSDATGPDGILIFRFSPPVIGGG